MREPDFESGAESPKDKTYQEIRANQSPEVPTVVPCPSKADCSSQFPPKLARVVAVWDLLPEAIKTAILALVQAAVANNRLEIEPGLHK